MIMISHVIPWDFIAIRYVLGPALGKAALMSGGNALRRQDGGYPVSDLERFTGKSSISRWDFPLSTIHSWDPPKKWTPPYDWRIVKYH